MGCRVKVTNDQISYLIEYRLETFRESEGKEFGAGGVD